MVLLLMLQRLQLLRIRLPPVGQFLAIEGLEFLAQLLALDGVTYPRT